MEYVLLISILILIFMLGYLIYRVNGTPLSEVSTKIPPTPAPQKKPINYNELIGKEALWTVKGEMKSFVNSSMGTRAYFFDLTIKIKKIYDENYCTYDIIAVSPRDVSIGVEYREEIIKKIYKGGNAPLRELKIETSGDVELTLNDIDKIFKNRELNMGSYKIKINDSVSDSEIFDKLLEKF